MDFTRNRFTALLAASTVAVAFSACGDDDGQGVGEEHRAREARGRRRHQEGGRGGPREGAGRGGEEARDAKRKARKARDDVEQDARDKADREIGEDDVRTKKDSDAR